MHRLLIDVPAGLMVDHINHDGLDNRKSNLRACAHAENVRNRKPTRCKRKSRFKGVQWKDATKGGGRSWLALIWVNNKRIHLGYFNSEINAATAFNLAAAMYHGDYAYYNYPGMPDTAAKMGYGKE